MKSLFLIRHAKSDWSEVGLADHDRKLNDRGRRDAPVMAERFLKEHGRNHRLVSSSAVRALSTCSEFAKALEIPRNEILIDRRVYEAAWSDLIRIINETDEEVHSLVIFGHNPGMSELVTYLCGISLHMPTCAIAELQPQTETWNTIASGTCLLKSFDYPKKQIA